MKVVNRAMKYILAALAVVALFYKHQPPSSPLPPHPSSKAISNVGMTPDYEPAAADAGKATEEINADKEAAATAEQHDADFATDVVSLQLTETSEDFEQATAKQEQQESAMVQACNATRARYGVAPCRESAALTAAAQGYANWLAYYNQEGHYCNGMPWGRAAAAGFTGTLLFNERLGNWYWTGQQWKREIAHDAGEVLGFGQPNMQAAFGDWLKSDGHRAALLEGSFDSAGFGYAVNRVSGRPIWVGMLGRQTKEAAPVRAAYPVSVYAGTPQRAAQSGNATGQSPGRTVIIPQSCPGGVCGQVFYPQRQYVQQPQQWQYQRPGLFGWRTR